MYRISRLQQEYQDDDEGALQPPLPPSHHVPQGPLGLVDASASNTVSLIHHATAASSFADTNDRSVPPRTKTKQASLDDSTASLSFSGDELHVHNTNNTKTANINTMTGSSNHTSSAINSGHEFEASREFSLSMLPTDHSASNHTGGYHSSLASFGDEWLHNDDHDNDMHGRVSHKQHHPQQQQLSTKTLQEEKVKQILAQRKLSASASTSGGYHSSGSNLHNSMSHSNSNSNSNSSSYSHNHAMQDDDDDEPPAMMQESLSSMPPLMTEEEEADADTETVAAVNMAPAPLVEVDRAAGRVSHDASFNKSSSRFSDSVARMSDTSGCSSNNRRRRSLSRTSKRSSKTVPLPPPPPPPVEPPPPHVLQQQAAQLPMQPMQDRSSRRRRPSRVKSVDGITNRFKTRQQQQQQPQVTKLQHGMEESSSSNSPMDFNMVDNAHYEEVEDDVAHIIAAKSMDESATSVRSRRIMNDVSNNSASVRRNKTGSAAAAVGKKEGRKPSRQIPPRSHTIDGRSTTSSTMIMTKTVPQPTAAVATTAATKRRPKRNQSTSVMVASSSSLMMVDHLPLPSTTTTLSSATKNKMSASLRRTRTAEEHRATPSSQAAQAAAMMDSSTSTSTSTGSDGGGSGSSGHSKQQQQQQQQQRLRSSSKKPKRNRSFTAKLAAAAAAPMRRSLRRTRTIDERKDGATNINNTMDTSAATSRTRSHSLRRTKTIDERTFPRRTMSTGFGTATKAQKPTSRKQQQKRHAAINRPATRLNIFGSDMVSTKYILGQLDLLANTSDIVHVELEDCLGRLDDGSHDIPRRLKQILQQDARPWETVVFTDELVDGFAYKDFKRRRKLFLRILDGVCAHKVIPVQYKLKVSLKDMIEEEDATNKNNDDDNNQDKDDDDIHHYNNSNGMDASCNTASSSFSQDDPTISSTGRCRPKGMDYMTHLIYEFQRDASVVDLTVTSNRATVELIHALIALLECDDRPWDNLALHLTSQGPPAAATLSQEDMIQWQNAMQATTQKLQQVAQARGIVWPSY